MHAKFLLQNPFMNMQSLTWVGIILGFWCARSYLDGMTFTSRSCGTIHAVTKSELHGKRRSGVALGPILPTRPAHNTFRAPRGWSCWSWNCFFDGEFAHGLLFAIVLVHSCHSASFLSVEWDRDTFCAFCFLWGAVGHHLWNSAAVLDVCYCHFTLLVCHLLAFDLTVVYSLYKIWRRCWCGAWWSLSGWKDKDLSDWLLPSIALEYSTYFASPLGDDCDRDTLSALGLLGRAPWNNSRHGATVTSKSDFHGAPEIYLSTFHMTNIHGLFNSLREGCNKKEKSEAEKLHPLQ